MIRKATLALLLLAPVLLLGWTFFASTSEAHPALAPLQQDELPLEMYITTARNGCPTASAIKEESITVARGTPIYFCYLFFNRTDLGTEPITFTNHIVTDGSATNVRATFPYTLPPGSNVNTWDPPLSLVISQTAETSGVETGIWAASDQAGRQLQASDSINLNVVNPVVEATLTLARSTTECGTDPTITVPLNTNNVSLCLTLRNIGDVPLASHQVVLSGGLTWSGVISRTLNPGDTFRLMPSNAGSFGNPPLTFPNISSSAGTSARVVVTSRYNANISTTSQATANVAIGSTALTFTGSVRPNPIVRILECPTGTTSNNITVVQGTLVYYCFHLNNTGQVPLTLHHMTAITPSIDITFTYDLQPAATLVLTNGMLAALGQPQVLGPITATRNIAATFILTSSNSAGFRVTPRSSVSFSVVTPTPSPTETSTSAPTFPTNTPTITPTPFPSPTPFPTVTPTMTPMPPTPTWTRSFALSGLATPTPPQVAGAAVVPTVDFIATAIARATQDTQATQAAQLGIPTPDPFAPVSPLSPLATPEAAGLDATQVALIAQATLNAAATMNVTPPPTWTPSLTFTPTRTPAPTASDTPTVTPTLTQRPINYPTPLPPPSFGNIFGQVLGSSAGATGFIFLLTGTLVFFGVAGGMLAWGFLRNARNRFEVYEVEEDDENPSTTSNFPITARDRRATNKQDWPSSLP